MKDNPLFLLVLFPLAAYIIGSTPFGVIISRFRGVDLRKQGSGNVGATNVGRVLGRKFGYICFFLDVSKGFIPVALVGLVLRDGNAVPDALSQAGWLAVGFGAIAGHVFSFYLRFRGGKGVATSLGVVLGIFPYFTLAGLATFALWIIIVLVTKYVSLASILAAAAFIPIFILLNLDNWLSLWPLATFAALMSSLIILRHRSNISRLLAGKENKVGRATGFKPNDQ